MEKPRLFISAVSRELKTARQRVANILTRKGYEPVWQDIFGTEPGDLRAMLREKIDTCAGLIQITGDTAGFSPADPDPDFGPCSYTQFEFLYALQQGKKTWLLLAGSEITRDLPPPLPAGPDDLQRAYMERPEIQQHLCHTAESDLALDLATERLHDELAALRAEWQQWQRNVSRTLTDTTRRQRTGLRLAAAGLVATSLVLLGLWWVQRTQDDTKKSQDNHAAAQNETLADLTKKLDEIKLDRAAAGQSFRNLTKEDLERLLAEKADITVQELRRRITAGAESDDPLERARALLLQGDFDAALQATAVLKESRTTDLIAILKLEAQAHEGKFQYQAVLAARQKVAALIDQEKEPAAWAVAQHWVAFTLILLGKSRDAEPLLRNIIAAQQRLLGPEHSDTLKSRNNLANALQSQGKYAEAEAEHRTRIAIEERVLGPEHPDTLASRNNLANALGEQGKNAQEEAEHRTVLAVRERDLGPEHPDTLKSRGNLAIALKAQGKNADAEAEHRIVLAGMERVLGPEHPDTLSTRNNLARAMGAQGKKAQEMEEHRTVLAIRERVLGPEHPDTMLSHFNLAVCLEKLGREKDKAGENDAALAHWRDALAHARTVQAAGARVFGKEHPYVARFDSEVADLEAKLKE